MSAPRRLGPIDRLLSSADNALRTIVSPPRNARRPNPARGVPEPHLPKDAARHAAGLMRVNQAGEVAAQGLYQGHAAVARDAALARRLHRAAEEELDHLSWCTERLRALDASPSVLNPVWYGGAFLLGAASGIAGDKWSLGFIAETERQVVEHLRDHLERLPAEDTPSRRILETMLAEEAEHGAAAKRAGGGALPGIARRMMTATSKIMTRTAYWL